MTDLINLTIFPPQPENEVPRDNVICQIAGTFNANCQKQVVTGKPLTGKTNMLTQFARYYSRQCISYFITEDPWTQDLYNFIYIMCHQLCELFEDNSLSTTADLENLKRLLTGLTSRLNKKAKLEETQFFYVIDGLEWGTQGIEGERIIDNLPRTFPIGPYLLYSCEETKLNNLPQHIKANYTRQSLEFSESETLFYLGHVGFSGNEAKEIHTRHRGNPGSLKAVYEAKKNDTQFSKELALQEYDKVIKQGINSFISSGPDFIKHVLSYLAVSPTGLTTNILIGLVPVEKEDLLNVIKSGSSIIILHNERVDFVNETVRNIYRRYALQNQTHYFSMLLKFIEKNHPNEDFLLTALYVKDRDYDGLKKQLDSSTIVRAMEDPRNGVSGVMQKLRYASQMAIDTEDYEGLLKWSLGVSLIKSYIEYAVNHDEIDALIAIGESQQALGKAYSLPDPTNRIRFIARIYSTMKIKNERISTEQLDEMEGLISNLDLSKIDKEIVEKLAIDIFPLLPDRSLTLLDTIKIDEAKNGVIELFSRAISAQSKEAADESKIDPTEKRHPKFIFDQNFSSWLRDKPVIDLEEEISHLRTTKAKEQLIRQWCKQNSRSGELEKGIFLWLETVKNDYDFIITLKSLRQISNLLKYIPINKRVELIRDLYVPRITTLDSPKQEWVRFNLNLAEGLAEINGQDSLDRVCSVYQQILNEPLDLDIKTFCLARTLSTVTRIFPEEKSIKDAIEKMFNETFYFLLKDSAEQFDSLKETLGAFVEYDIDSALIMASELNTEQRRDQAKAHIFRVAILKRGEENIGKVLNDILENLNENRQISVIINVLNEIRGRGYVIANENLNVLHKFAKGFDDTSHRSLSLSLIAALMSSTGGESAKLALESWRKEEDLKIKLWVGFQMVKTLAQVDLELAKSIYHETQSLCSQPGASLAVSSLGIEFFSNVELAIRIIASLPNELDSQEVIQEWISWIPSKKIQGDLYAKLASSLYRGSSTTNQANEIIRTKVLPIIGGLISPVDKRDLIYFSLPVIYKYDQREAEVLSNTLLPSQQDGAWISVMFWLILKCLLGDQTNIDVDNIKIYLDRPQLREIVAIANKLQQDVAIHLSIKAISHIIYLSCHHEQINETQTFELLDDLEKLVECKLPDTKNIKHQGYSILAESEIHRVRSKLFNEKKGRNLNKVDIRKKWQKLCEQAKQIPNMADRVFVTSLVVRNMSDYHEKDKTEVINILQNTFEQINNIPTLIDRFDRLDIIAETWHKIGEKSKAKFVNEQGIALLNQFDGSSRDEKMKAIVQTAYTIGDAELASQVVSQIDRPYLLDGMLSTPQRTFQLASLRKQPTKINEIINVTNLSHEREYMLGLGASHLLEDLVTKKGKVDHPQTLGLWLHKSQDLHPNIIRSVSNWVVENWVRGSTSKELTIFQEIIDLVKLMAESAFSSQYKIISESTQGGFVGSNPKYVIFRQGETEKAQTWLCDWIKINARKYLKICDPYFGLDELKYLSYVPEDCIVFIVTSNKAKGMQAANLESVTRYWQEISTRIIPFTRFIIASDTSQNRFHDRVIISNNIGLDLGPSLNGLGKSQQKISILSQEDAKELEDKYLKKLLDLTVWLLEYKETPILFDVGKLPSS